MDHELPADKIMFIADLSDDVRRRAVELATACRAPGVRFKFQSLDVIHMTIVMAGHDAPHTIAKAQQVAGLVRCPAVDVSLETLMVFAGPKRILGLHAAVTPAPWRQLRRQLGDVSRRLNTEKVGGASPHISLAYNAPALPKVTLSEPLAIRIDAFKLVRSVQGEGRHDELGRWFLQ